ncbi:MAG: response regulator transcription factor [Pseudomonadota bacterium]
MKILIADDHELVRDMICAFLEREADFSVTSTNTFDEAAEQMKAQGPFDLVLLDYDMPGMSGLKGLSEAIALNDGKPVCIMSGVAQKSIAQDALNSGAAGFIPKTMAGKSLVNAVRFMEAGEQYAPIDFMTRKEPEDVHPLADRLSEREQEVLSGLCKGLSNKEIARELDLQEVTIKLHVKTLCRKLEARNRTHAAMIAKDAGVM